ncbi:skin secretory protein xP2-like [Iris pallida]|uniref:Skin secretory protein xP2-like n=1 Tax=Iris pallida TaxID=29817 RepID=A0AAX6GXX3_IRIPA|nr:skin secretory protein xP2-like [Iris pallida]
MDSFFRHHRHLLCSSHRRYHRVRPRLSEIRDHIVHKQNTNTKHQQPVRYTSTRRPVGRSCCHHHPHVSVVSVSNISDPLHLQITAYIWFVSVAPDTATQPAKYPSLCRNHSDTPLSNQTSPPPLTCSCAVLLWSPAVVRTTFRGGRPLSPTLVVAAVLLRACACHSSEP